MSRGIGSLLPVGENLERSSLNFLYSGSSETWVPLQKVFVVSVPVISYILIIIYWSDTFFAYEDNKVIYDFKIASNKYSKTYFWLQFWINIIFKIIFALPSGIPPLPDPEKFYSSALKKSSSSSQNSPLHRCLSKF